VPEGVCSKKKTCLYLILCFELRLVTLWTVWRHRCVRDTVALLATRQCSSLPQTCSERTVTTVSTWIRWSTKSAAWCIYTRRYSTLLICSGACLLRGPDWASTMWSTSGVVGCSPVWQLMGNTSSTICENERIYCNYLLIPHTSQTKISSHTCCIKTHTRSGYSSLPIQ